MNPVKLIQKQGFTSYEFTLTDNTLSVKQNTFAENKVRVIKLDNLGYKTTLEKEASLTRKLVAIYFGLSSLIMVIANVADHSNHMNIWFWFSLSTVNFWMATAMFLTPKTNELRLVGGYEELSFLTDKPSEKEVRGFVDEIIIRSKKVLLRKYGTLDPDLPENLMISQLNWLLQKEVVDSDEFKEKKALYYSERQPRND